MPSYTLEQVKKAFQKTFDNMGEVQKVKVIFTSWEKNDMIWDVDILLEHFIQTLEGGG